MNPYIIGTGFYSSLKDFEAKYEFFKVWSLNYPAIERPKRIIVVDNSAVGLPIDHPNIIKIFNNLGRNEDTIPGGGSHLRGWSMSWIIPALIAYSEGCDFVYKEQDCLAFGDWLPAIKKGRMAVGHNSIMPCEQSLFWIERDFIPIYLAPYLGHRLPDSYMMTEDKMVDVGALFGNDFQFHDLPFGRERPLTFHTDRPWYAQRFTQQEMEELRKLKLI